MDKKHILIWGGGLILCFLLSFTLSVSSGSEDIHGWIIWQVILHKFLPSFVSLDQIDPIMETIIWKVRLPRILFSMLVGALLAGAGVILQGLLQNPLADPYVLGISSGASVGAVLAILTGWGLSFLGIWHIPFIAFLFASLSLGILFFLSDHRLQTGSLILTGVIVNSFFGALLTWSMTWQPEKLPQIQYWLMGSFSLKEWDFIWILLPITTFSFMIAMAYAPQLNLLLLGDRKAGHLGVNVRKVRGGLLLVASLMTATSVAVSGMIGFVGLVIPHTIRYLTGANHRTLLPFSAIAGASFLMLSDWLARILLAPKELPIGVITAMIGAPFFAWIMKRRQGSI